MKKNTPTHKDTVVRRNFFILYVFLLAALALNMGATLINLGSFAVPLRLALAGVMAVLIAVIFMRLRSSSALVRLAAVMSLLWVIFLFVLTFADYFTR